MDYNDQWMKDLIQYFDRVEQEGQQIERFKQRMIKHIRANEMRVIDDKIQKLYFYTQSPLYQKAWNIISVNRKKENEITVLAKYIRDLEQRLGSIRGFFELYYQGRNWID